MGYWRSTKGNVLFNQIKSDMLCTMYTVGNTLSFLLVRKHSYAFPLCISQETQYTCGCGRIGLSDFADLDMLDHKQVHILYCLLLLYLHFSVKNMFWIFTRRSSRWKKSIPTFIKTKFQLITWSQQTHLKAVAT